jgi:hypothetical protein
MMGDNDLNRLRTCLRALQDELETCRLPRATQLPPIPGLPPVDIVPGARPIEHYKRTVELGRPRNAFSGLAKLLIACAVVVPLACFIAARGLDDVSTWQPPSTDRQLAALLHLRQAVPPSTEAKGIAAGSALEDAIQDASLQPTDLEEKPTEDEIAMTSLRAARGSENSALIPELTQVTQASLQSNATTVLDPQYLKVLIGRGRQFFDAGDMAAARLLFNRAALAGDATAAVAMGTTYDPAVLGMHGVRGMSADLEKARSWYEKAAGLGSPEGLRLLETLKGRLSKATMRRTADQVDTDEALAKVVFPVSRDPVRKVQRAVFSNRSVLKQTH